MRLLPSRRGEWIAAAVLLSASAWLAHRQGWLDSLPWTAHRQSHLSQRGSIGVPDPDDSVAADDLDDLALAARLDQFEPDEPAPAPKRRDDAQRAAAPFLELDADEGALAAKSRGSSSIATVGFDEAPPAPAAPPDNRRGETASVARRPVEASKAAAQAGSVSSAPGKRRALVERQKIQELIDAGDYVEAQKELSEWYWQLPAQRDKLLPELNKMSRALYFSPQPQYYDPYVVRPGDQLRVVGQRFKLSWEYLARLNRVDPRKIRMGQKLKVVPGPFAAIIYLDRYELVVHLDGSFVKSYRVGLGKDGATPVGTFEVKNKMVDPTYYGPEGVIAHDDPKNPLGERWVDIGDGFGIHGTIEPDSIGKNESRGCIRLLNSDVEEVYDFLVIGSEVKIVRK